MTAFKPLNDEEINILKGHNCTASDWSAVQVGEGFEPERVRNVEFIGSVKIGALNGSIAFEGGVNLPAEIINATIANCEIGNNVRINTIRGHLANYRIGDGAALTDIGVMATTSGATFGNGVELETANEGGGREVKLFNEISSQFAYLVCMHRYRTEMVKKLNKMVDDYISQNTPEMGMIGEGAIVQHVPEIIDVNIGPYAQVSGAARLRNGTILSEKAAPAKVGSSVMADDFIFAEGSSVDTGALLSKVFVGQASKVGRQFSGENTMLFANCEAMHSEAVAVFGGPYTVTHHRSTLLIAGTFSFYNAGSGTNQSNHMYKLGPLHQGLLERGSKTGSFSYLLWPCVVSPFSVVIGKNMANFDISELPFSYVTAEEDGSYLTPAMNMFTVGTTRDGAKWPARDKRKATNKRDRIRFEVFSPYTVGRMLKGEEVLTRLHNETDRSRETVRYNGVTIKRLLLRTGAKNYRQGIDRYLHEKIIERAQPVISSGIEAVRKAFALDDDAVFCRDWSDISGLLISRDRLQNLENDIESGKIATVQQFNESLEGVWASYEKDEWAWVRTIYEERTGKSLDDLTMEDLQAISEAAAKAKASFAKKILADAQKEFDESSMLGFGADGTEEDMKKDFEEVRGTYEGNSFVKKMQDEADEKPVAIS